MKYVGYARVSTAGQSLDSQVDQLRAAGARKIYREKVSGAIRGRAQIGKMLAELQPGDVVLVTRLDRLARSTVELLTILDRIGESGAGFRSLADTWADTTTAHGRLMLTILGGLAEFERDLIRARTSEGKQRARERGVHMGRPPALTDHQRREALVRRERGLETLAEIALSYNVHRSTIARLK